MKDDTCPIDWSLFRSTEYRTVQGACVTCGDTFTGSAGRRYCSPVCRPGAVRCSGIAYGKCSRCAETFVRRDGQLGRYCSRRCTKSAERRRHRARKRGQVHEPYTLREIAERDGWRCHLCGGKVPDRPYTAHDNDATIDHLIPQSAGGDDVKSNVALAHNRCNYMRGATPLGSVRG